MRRHAALISLSNDHHHALVEARRLRLAAASADPDEAVAAVRYRARTQVCNACAIKARCTDSDRGREVVTPLDPWPHSEAGRFHRVIAAAAWFDRNDAQGCSSPND